MIINGTFSSYLSFTSVKKLLYTSSLTCQQTKSLQNVHTCLVFTLTIGLICCHMSPDNAKRLKVTLESKILMFDLSSDL